MTWLIYCIHHSNDLTHILHTSLQWHGPCIAYIIAMTWPMYCIHHCNDLTHALHTSLQWFGPYIAYIIAITWPIYCIHYCNDLTHVLHTSLQWPGRCIAYIIVMTEWKAKQTLNSQKQQHILVHIGKLWCCLVWVSCKKKSPMFNWNSAVWTWCTLGHVSPHIPFINALMSDFLTLLKWRSFVIVDA